MELDISFALARWQQGAGFVVPRTTAEGRPKATPATQNASQKSSRGTKIRKLGGGRQILKLLPPDVIF